MQTQRRPLQVYLRPQQDRVLRLLADRQRVSLAELVRRSLDLYLEAALPAEKDPSLGLIGLGHSGCNDLSAQHDALVAIQARGDPAVNGR